MGGCCIAPGEDEDEDEDLAILLVFSHSFLACGISAS